MATNQSKVYELFESGLWYGRVIATRLTEALSEARANVVLSRYQQPTNGHTVYVEIGARVKSFPASNRKVGALHDIVTIHPLPPPCSPPDKLHIWRAPETVVGRGEIVPGIEAHGDGIIVTEICPRCGWYKVEDTCATRPETGMAGYSSIRYLPPDEKSRAYVSECARPIIFMPPGLANTRCQQDQ